MRLRWRAGPFAVFVAALLLAGCQARLPVDRGLESSAGLATGDGGGAARPSVPAGGWAAAAAASGEGGTRPLTSAWRPPIAPDRLADAVRYAPPGGALERGLGFILRADICAPGGH